MSSQARNERGDANRLDLRTLVIASLASAVAAIVVSRVWASGTPIAAAATPVLVTLIREVLDHPTSKIAERFTADTRAVPDTEVREPVSARTREPSAPQPGPSRRMPPPTEPRDRAGGGAGTGEGGGDIRVYRQQPTGRTTGRINPKIALITGLLAFLIAGLVITGGQILAGSSPGSGGNGAIILGQKKTKAKPSSTKDEQQQSTTPDQQQTTPQDQQQTTPQDQKQQKTTTTPPDQKKAPPQTAPQPSPRNVTPTTPAAPPASP